MNDARTEMAGALDLKWEVCAHDRNSVSGKQAITGNGVSRRENSQAIGAQATTCGGNLTVEVPLSPAVEGERGAMLDGADDGGGVLDRI